MPDVTTFQILSAALGTLGAILGVLNYWRSRDSDRVRLKVSPEIYTVTPGGRAFSTTLDKMPKNSASDLPLQYILSQGELSIRITNMSKFPVTISKIGISVTKKGDSYLLSNMTTSDDKVLPIRLDSRDSIVLLRRSQPISRVHPKKAKVQVVTACGYSAMASSPAFKAWITPGKKNNQSGRSGD